LIIKGDFLLNNDVNSTLFAGFSNKVQTPMFKHLTNFVIFFFER